MKTTAKAAKRRAPPESAQLSVRVTDHIEKLISEGRVQPGERLNELALAERLGVSRAPVREALRSLEGRGWLTQIANRGMFVRELSVKEMLDIFDMRALLVGYAAERASELLNSERRKALAKLLDEMDKAAKSDDGTRYYRLNTEYHDAILAFSNNQRAVEVYAELAKDLHRFQRRYFDFAPNMVKSNAEHRAVFDAIVRGDAAEARRLSEQHVQQGKLRVLQTLQSN
ncbi:MAG: ydfH 5 [Betaproteobacteria bacterium]|nr:ydfH 5 [Betaproteobacteria bacterium]